LKGTGTVRFAVQDLVEDLGGGGSLKWRTSRQQLEKDGPKAVNINGGS
jgi:hypothetical protein